MIGYRGAGELLHIQYEGHSPNRKEGEAEGDRIYKTSYEGGLSQGNGNVRHFTCLLALPNV